MRPGDLSWSWDLAQGSGLSIMIYHDHPPASIAFGIIWQHPSGVSARVKVHDECFGGDRGKRPGGRYLEADLTLRM